MKLYSPVQLDYAAVLSRENEDANILDGVGFVVIELVRLQAGKRYLLDVSMDLASKAWVTVYPGPVTQTHEGAKHLLLVYEASSTSGAMYVSATGTHNGKWNFYSCEVTPLE